MTVKKIAQLTGTEKDKILVPLINFFREHEDPCVFIECNEPGCGSCPLHELHQHFVLLRDDVTMLAKDNGLSMY